MDFYTNNNFEQLSREFAHEVKNPLSLIKANIDYLQTSDTDGVYEKNYGVIKKELQKITNVVKDFIKVAKPFNSIDSTSYTEIIFIEDLVADVIEEFSTPIGDKKIQYELHCINEDLKIIGEYSKICIVFFNLLKNSIEAIESEGKITIDISEKDKDIVIRITDNGAGIKKGFEETVGTPFVTTKSTGSGLGLSICQKIIESHKGSFRLFNNKDSERGCTAEIVLKKYEE